jgi:hypothetical protein
VFVDQIVEIDEQDLRKQKNYDQVLPTKVDYVEQEVVK